jgi:hydrogenase/urease accessory protein HupE
MKRAQRLLVLIAAATAAGPALAHPGDHSQITFAGLIEHLLQPDHAAFIVAIAVGLGLSLRAVRRDKARAQEKPQ